jgi:hypothetical protein
VRELSSAGARLTLGLLAAIALAQAFANPWWLLEPGRFAPIDDSYVYLSNLFRAFDGLGAVRSPADLWQSLETISVGGRPPLKQLLTLPLLAVLGRGEKVALAVNLFYTLLLVVSTYKLGRHFAGRGVALLAALVTATLPPIVWLSRMYVPYGTVPACVALVCWRCVELLRDRRAGNVWWVGAATAFALLHHPHATWFLAAPVALAVVWSWLSAGVGPEPLRDRAVRLLRDRFLWRGVAPAAAVCGAAVLGWYLTIGYQLLEKLIMLSDLESFRGVKVRAGGFPGIDASFWWYLRTAPAAVTNVVVLAALLGIALWLWKGPATGRWLAISALCGYVVASRQNNLVWFVMAGLLPVVAVAAVSWIDRLGPRAKAGAVTVAVAVSLVNYAAASFELGDAGKALLRGLGYPVAIDRQIFYAGVPAALRTAEREVLAGTARELARDPRCRQRCQLLVSATRTLSYARLEFYFVAHHPRLNVRIVNEGTEVWGTQYRLSGLVDSEFLLYPKIIPVPTLYQRATLRLLNRSDVFAQSHEHLDLELPPLPRLTLARRLRPLTSAEVERVIRELELEPRYKQQRFEVLAAVLLDERRFEAAEEQVRAGLAELGPAPALAHRGIRVVDGYLQQNDLERAAAVSALLVERFPAEPRVGRIAARVERELRKAGRAAAASGADAGPQLPM